MGLFDQFKNKAVAGVKSELRQGLSQGEDFLKNAVAKGMNRDETFRFANIPAGLAELQAFPEASMDSAFKTAALVMIALCNLEKNETATFEMLDYLKGPESLSGYEKQFIKERLSGKYYKTFSFFAGATKENGYTPTVPYTITVSENPYSFDEENWAVMYVTSAGADGPRPIKLRKKPSTGQWFLNDIQCLADIRTPANADPWA